MFGHDHEPDRVATPAEACKEFAWNYGMDHPDKAWLLSDYDTWEKNPHYKGPPVPHPEDDDYDHRYVGRLLTAADAKQFVLAGRAVITAVSLETGKRYTFKITRRAVGKPWFVSVMYGPDNTSHYAYMGQIFDELGEYVVGKFPDKTHIGPEDIRQKAFKKIWGWLQLDRIPPKLEIWHEGQCARCGRPLTTPDSIARGFGPECASQLGLI